MSTIKFLQSLEFHDYQQFREAVSTDYDRRRSRSLSSKRTRQSRPRKRNNEEEDSVETLFESFKIFAISGIESPNPQPTFNAAFASFRELNEAEIARRKRKKRRYLFWNCGSIHSSMTNNNGMPQLKEEFKELVKNIQPDGILLNELRLKTDSVENFYKKFKSQISDLGYAIMSSEDSYFASPHWIRGSAILIHKSVSDQYADAGTFSARTNGFEVVSVRDCALDIPVYCCYFPSGLQNDSTRNEIAINLVNSWTKGVGAGDLNMRPREFKAISNQEDCMNQAWLTHKRAGSLCQPTKIDYVFKSRSEKNVSVKVHKPLLPDSYLSDAHYPIIFDVFRNIGGNDSTKNYCDDNSCEFVCGRRQGGIKGPQQRSASEGRRGRDGRGPSGARSQSRRRN